MTTETFNQVYKIDTATHEPETVRVGAAYICHHDTSPRFECVAMHNTYIGVWAVTGEHVKTGAVQNIYEIDLNPNETPGFLEDGVRRGDRTSTYLRETLEEAMQLVFELSRALVVEEPI